MKRKLVKSATRAVKRTKTASYVNQIASSIAAALHVSKGSSRTRTKTKKKQKKKSKMEHGERKRVKTRKVRVFNDYPKGVSKKFFKKTNAVINHRGIYGEYKYTACIRLAQASLDICTPQYLDENNRYIQLGTFAEIVDAASVLFNGKAMASNWETATNNLTWNSPIYVDMCNIEMFFKSTSSHVVNIEIWECTPRQATVLAAPDLANESLQDAEYTFNLAGSTASPGDTAIATIQPEHLGRLNEFFYVKRHTIKLKPGDYTSMRFNGAKRTTYDGSKMVDANVTDTINGWHKYKHMKSFLFRTINDITVSGTTGDIHAWPSNSIGGVAMRYTKTFKIKMPQSINPGGKKNAFKYGFFSKTVGSSTDQQVTYENPINTAAINN